MIHRRKLMEWKNIQLSRASEVMDLGGELATSIKSAKYQITL